MAQKGHLGLATCWGWEDCPLAKTPPSQLSTRTIFIKTAHSAASLGPRITLQVGSNSQKFSRPNSSPPRAARAIRAQCTERGPGPPAAWPARSAPRRCPAAPWPRSPPPMFGAKRAGWGGGWGGGDWGGVGFTWKRYAKRRGGTGSFPETRFRPKGGWSFLEKPSGVMQVASTGKRGEAGLVEGFDSG